MESRLIEKFGGGGGQINWIESVNALPKHIYGYLIANINNYFDYSAGSSNIFKYLNQIKILTPWCEGVCDNF